MRAGFGTVAYGAPRLSVAPRSLGYPTPSYPGAVASNAQLTIAVDRLQTRLASPLSAFGTVMTVEDGTGIVANVLLSIDDELVQTQAGLGNVWNIIRGRDGTAPAVHLQSALVSGYIDAYHHNALASEIQAIENALGPNLSKIPTAISINSSLYNFAAQTPGNVLAPGANSINLNPMPQGLAVGNWLYISGGTGTAEAVQLTGVAASSVIVNCANAHSGAWTIQSATAGVQEAMVVASQQAVLATVMITSQSYFYAVANVPMAGADRSITLRGQGKSTFTIFRHTSYRTGDLLSYNGTSAAGQIGFEVHDMLIMDGAPDHAWTPNAGSSAIHIKNSLAANRVIDNVSITNPYIGIDLEGAFVVEIHNVQVGWGANPSVPPIAAIKIHGLNSVLGNPGSIINISDLQVLAQPGSTTSFVQSGIAISCVDGCQIINSSIIQVEFGVLFNPTTATDQVDDVFLEAVLIDAVRKNNVVFTGNGGGVAYMGDIAIRGCYFTMWPSLAPAPGTLTSGIQIDPNCLIQSLVIEDTDITTSGLSGILIAGTNLKKMIIGGCRINDTDSLHNGYAGIQLLAGVSNVLIQGNTVGNTGQFAGHMQYALNIDGSGGSQNITVVGNDFRGADTAPIILPNGPPANFLLSNNGGVDDVIPNVAAAASIAAPVNPTFTVTGAVTILTITGGWRGVRKRILKPDAGSVTIGGGGNIPGVHTLASNQAIDLVFNGTSWF